MRLHTAAFFWNRKHYGLKYALKRCNPTLRKWLIAFEHWQWKRAHE